MNNNDALQVGWHEQDGEPVVIVAEKMLLTARLSNDERLYFTLLVSDDRLGELQVCFGYRQLVDFVRGADQFITASDERINRPRASARTSPDRVSSYWPVWWGPLRSRKARKLT